MFELREITHGSSRGELSLYTDCIPDDQLPEWLHETTDHCYITVQLTYNHELSRERLGNDGENASMKMIHDRREARQERLDAEYRD